MHLPTILANGISHLDFQVGPQQVVLTDIQVADCCLWQFVCEPLPAFQRDIEILPDIERPDVPLLEDFRQQLELPVVHALHPSAFPALRFQKPADVQCTTTLSRLPSPSSKVS